MSRKKLAEAALSDSFVLTLKALEHVFFNVVQHQVEYRGRDFDR